MVLAAEGPPPLYNIKGYTYPYNRRRINMAKNIKSFSELRPLPAYELVSEEYLGDIKSCGLYFRHKKSGARVCVFSNDDENKVFCAGFRTTPENSTGVPHIIEHSVLNGSENFPSRDPFMSLVKGSLHTFLNAMTYPDKTIYPVASCNDADFKNLMHVYLDSVFHPLIYKRKEIFMQEGWHYELASADDELTINGVVYSEMKGALSTPDSVVYENVQQRLYPDNTYGVNSGGDPDHIPELTYEAFLNFHRSYYHPVNSYICIYGDVDVEERLEWLDENYLSDYDIIDLDSTITLQPEIGGVIEASDTYSVGAEDEIDGKSYFAYASLCGNVDVLEGAAWSAISDALIYAPGAPIKQALLDAGIGNEIYGGYNDHMRQPFFAVIAKEAKSEDKDKFFEIVDNVLREQVANGISRESLLSAISSAEFKWREADYGGMPKGLVYIINSYASWLYDDDAVFAMLKNNSVYKELKDKLSTRYFEELIEKYLLNSRHVLRYNLEPERGLLEKKNAELKEKLAAYKASLSKEEIDGIVSATKQLRDYQSAPPTEEELTCIPSISRSDIKREAAPFHNEERTIGGTPAVFHDVGANGVAYVKFVFRADGLPTELLPYAGLISEILGNVDTDKHSYFELSNDIGINTGGVHFGFGLTRKAGTNDEFMKNGTVSVSALSEKVAHAIDLCGEIISSSKLNDKKRLREIISEHQSGKLSGISGSGNSYASLRASSYFSKASAAEDITYGIEAYSVIKEAMADFDKNADAIIEKITAAVNYIFRPENLLISVAADEIGYKQLEDSIESFKASLRTCESPTGSTEITPVKKNEGFAMPIQVQYVTRAGDMTAAGYKYSGALSVLRTCLSIDYLYQEIRVKGGAYGQGCNFSPSGMVSFTSYRDPQLRTTDEVYLKTGDFVRSLDLGEAEMTKLIIGTFSGLDHPKTTRQKAESSLGAYLTGRKFEDVQRERSEALDVTLEDLKAQADMIDAVLAQGYACTIGNDTKLRENADMFDTVVTLS